MSDLEQLPDAVVLAGGRSSRLGRDKAAAEVGGLPLLDRVLRAAAPVSGRLVVVGPPRPLAPGTVGGPLAPGTVGGPLAPGTVEGPLAPGTVGAPGTASAPAPVWCREEPPGGGPVAAVAAALPHVRADRVFVLAVDLPFLTAEALAALAAAGPSAIAVDGGGRDQGLLGIWRTAELRAALPADPAGRSWRAVTRGIEVTRVRLPGRLPPETDCDTAAQLAAASLAVTRNEPSLAMAAARPGGNTGPVTEPAEPGPAPGRRGTTLADWVELVRADLDLPAVDSGALLDLARDVAHGVARPAAPLTTFLVGLAAGRAGGTPTDVAAVAERVRALLPVPTDGDAR